MRHGIGYRKLNKTGEHRKALFKNMLNSLIKYEQIITTLPKAKELKPQIDKVITIGKKNILSNKKRLFSKLQDKNPYASSSAAVIAGTTATGCATEGGTCLFATDTGTTINIDTNWNGTVADNLNNKVEVE